MKRFDETELYYAFMKAWGQSLIFFKEIDFFFVLQHRQTKKTKLQFLHAGM